MTFFARRSKMLVGHCVDESFWCGVGWGRKAAQERGEPGGRVEWLRLSSHTDTVDRGLWWCLETDLRRDGAGRGEVQEELVDDGQIEMRTESQIEFGPIVGEGVGVQDSKTDRPQSL